MDDDLFLSIESLDIKQANEAAATELENKQEAVVVPEVQTEENNNNNLQTQEQKTETEKPGEVKELEKTPDSENNDSSSTISVLANYLKEEGVFSSDIEGFDKVNSIEDLKNLFAKQVEASRFSDLSEHQKRYLESIESGIPLNEYEELQRDVRNLESITPEELEEDQNLRFNIIAEDLIQSGLSKDKAIDIATRSVESGKDIEDAKESIKSLYERTVEKFKATVDTKKTEKQATLTEVKTLIDSKTSIMNDISLSKEEKDKIFKTMTTQVDTTQNGAPLNAFEKWRKDNGVEAEIILNALFVNTDGFKSLGTIKTEQKTSAARQLEEKLRSVDREELTSGLNVGQSVKGLRLQ